MLPKNPWSAKEDRVLFDVVSLHGPKNWSYIAQFLPDRTGKQCRERWHNHVDPNVKKGLWHDEEDKIILWQFKQHGAKWAKIARYLPGRTDNAIKNRFNGHLRKLIDAGKIDLETIDKPLSVNISNDSSDDEDDEYKQMMSANLAHLTKPTVVSANSAPARTSGVMDISSLVSNSPSLTPLQPRFEPCRKETNDNTLPTLASLLLPPSMPTPPNKAASVTTFLPSFDLNNTVINQNNKRTFTRFAQQGEEPKRQFYEQASWRTSRASPPITTSHPVSLFQSSVTSTRLSFLKSIASSLNPTNSCSVLSAPISQVYGSASLRPSATHMRTPIPSRLFASSSTLITPHQFL